MKAEPRPLIVERVILAVGMALLLTVTLVNRHCIRQIREEQVRLADRFTGSDAERFAEALRKANAGRIIVPDPVPEK